MHVTTDEHTLVMLGTARCARQGTSRSTTVARIYAVDVESGAVARIVVPNPPTDAGGRQRHGVVSSRATAIRLCEETHRLCLGTRDGLVGVWQATAGASSDTGLPSSDAV